MLYEEYHGYCMSICLRYAESREDAVEMMNDGFLKVFNYIKSYDHARPFKTWLRRIMINSTLDHIKKYQIKLEQQEIEEGIRELISETQLDQLSYEELLGLIRELPLAYRTVFNLHAIEGYKHEEIAEMLNISTGTSKSNYFKAKKKLQELLRKYFEVEY
ncbi:RNA polymerase sigma factor [Fulvivirga sp. 2943]|uniref:RNA polymerase sigma factor n=2 Tax=Fulvivirga sediminis TaxID=2803949 RepID=A0A937K015_9BACT|nr:RNA polymerase sigma factor [Fulvivirga sediminis]